MAWRKTTLRYPIAIFVASAAWVVVVEHVLLHDPTPLLARLSADAREDFYKQCSGIAGTLLGFLIAAVAIMASLDTNREIVKDLRRGEAFQLLVTNLVAACCFLLAVLALGIAGWVADNGAPGSDIFQSIYEVFGYAATVELSIGIFWFAVVTYKIAKYP